MREYLESSHGTITIEDNLGTGAVVTVSLVREEDDPLDDWDETDVLSSKGEYIPSSSYASETAVVHQPYAAPLVSGTEPYPPIQPESIPPWAHPAHQGRLPTHPPTRRKATAQYPRLQLPYRLPLTEPLTRDIRATGPMEPPQLPIRPTEQRQHRRRIRVTRSAVMPAPALSERERIFLKLLLKEGTLRNKDFSDLTETPASTTNTTSIGCERQVWWKWSGNSGPSPLTADRSHRVSKTQALPIC